MQGGERVMRNAGSELLGQRDDLGLAARILAQNGSIVAARIRYRLRPVEFDDLLGQLPGGDRIRRDAGTGHAFHTNVDNSQEDGVFVGGGEGALVEEGEDAFCEGDGAGFLMSL
jgi:hypothetical protein